MLRLGIAGFVVLAILILSGCGSAGDYSSDAIEELAVVRSGIDPNRSSPNADDEKPDQLASSDEAGVEALPIDQIGTTDLGLDGSASGGIDAEGMPPSSQGDQDEQREVIQPLTPNQDPAGRPYQRCVVGYGGIDWNAPSSEIEERYATASSEPCAAEQWYEATASQNGTLIFMVLSGEQGLLETTPSLAASEQTATSLVAQGYPKIDRMEIASSGACENGEIQLAILELREGLEVDPSGLDEILNSAAAVGALVDQREGVTLISGGGSPCVSGIVTKPGLVAWLTSSDTDALVGAAQFLVLSSDL